MTKDITFPGLTRTACADGCNATACMISGKSYCAHPTKGGLQPIDMGNPDALARAAGARDALSRDNLEGSISRRREFSK